jgi:hypothetical protein
VSSVPFPLSIYSIDPLVAASAVITTVLPVVTVPLVITSVESYSDRWLCLDTNSIYYDINKQDNGKEKCISNDR